MGWLWSTLLIVGLISSSAEAGCELPYDQVGDLCLVLLQGTMNLHESSCQSLSPKGIPVRRRLNDEQWEAFKEFLVKKTQTYPAAFLGMQKQGGGGGLGVGGGTTWEYSNGETFEQDDYKLWAQNHPSQFNKCGALSKNAGFRVESVSCDQESIAMCEKDKKPCFHSSMFYSEYFGRCLSISNNKDNYANIATYCADGHLLMLNNETDLEKAIPLLYTFQAGVYGGLRKKDGKWFFNHNGKQVEETERLGPSVSDYQTELDCGVWGIGKGEEVIMFTASCESTVRFICEPIGNQQFTDFAACKCFECYKLMRCSAVCLHKV